MPYYQALGTGPVSFVDANQSQEELPLSAIYFSANGVAASSSPLYTSANQGVILALLQQMVAQGFVAAASQPVTPPSLTVTAVQAGPMGNTITVVLSDPSAAAGTVTVTVSATEVYSGLTPAALGTSLGTSAAAANGLVYLSDPGTGEMPAAYTGTIGPGPGFDAAVPEAADNSQTAFTLAATSTSDATDAENIQITVAPASGATPTTFTLTVSWSKVATGITLASLSTATPFSYLITVSGQSGPLPAAGTVTLSGGASAAGTTPATPASASLLASS